MAGAAVAAVGSDAGVRPLADTARQAARGSLADSQGLAARARLSGLPQPSGVRLAQQLRHPPARTVQLSLRSEEHTSELQSPMRISYVVLCLKKKRIIEKRLSRISP